MLEPLPSSDWTRRTADHLLSRAAFGGTPAQREALYVLGRDEGIATAVNSLVDQNVDWDTAFPFPAWTSSESTILNEYYNANGLGKLERWYFDMLFEGPPVAAKMIKFLMDHFAATIFMVMDDAPRVLYGFKHADLIRKHALGDFKALTDGMGWDGSMSFMLDLHVNVRGNVNENYGRELLELFTMGVDGGYTEADVNATARAFTGRRLSYYNYPYPSFLGPFLQDTDPKTLLGQSITDGASALNVIFSQTQTGKFLAKKLWRYFVEPLPSDELVAALGERLRVTHGYQIAPFLKEVFLSREFYAPTAIGSQIKDPHDLIFTACKALELPLPPLNILASLAFNLAYQPHSPSNVNGWPKPDHGGNGWLNGGAMMYRTKMPALWVYRDVTQLNSTAQAEIGSWPLIDWDSLVAPEFRALSAFDLLLETLRQRLIPFHTFETFTVRALRTEYERTWHAHGDVWAMRDLARLLMCLPEYQLQ